MEAGAYQGLLSVNNQTSGLLFNVDHAVDVVDGISVPSTFTVSVYLVHSSEPSLNLRFK
jgi:hypothetical protein